MKKSLTIFLAVLLTLTLTACNSTNEQTVIEQKNTYLNNLQNLKTKEEFASFLNIEKPKDTEQLLAYLENYYNHLPYENETVENIDATTTLNGYNCLTIDQIKTLVTPTVLTTDNWKEYLEPSVKTITYSYTDEEGKEIEENYEEVNVGFKEGYNPRWNDFHLILYNQATGFSYDYTGWFWPEQLSYEDGKYYVDFYNDDIGEIKEEFNLDNYICTYADGVLYKNNVEEKYCYLEQWNDDNDQEFVPTSNKAEAVVYVLENNDDSDYSWVGYTGLGAYVYCNEEILENINIDKEITNKSSAKLTLDVIQACQTKEDVAAIIGATNLKDTYQNLVYLKIFYNHLPSESQQKKEITTWGTTNEGYNSLTIEEAKTLVTPFIITTENWKEFIEPYMQDVDSYSYDENGNEIYELIQEPEIGINYDYYYSRSDVKLTLINNNTGHKFNFYGTWGERISLEDGKYYVTSYDENGFGQTVEFNIDDYTCTFADAVIYQYDLNHELLYREYLDEENEEWIIEKVDESAQEYDEYYTVVLVQYGKTNADICRVGYSSFGSYIFDNCNIERLLEEAKDN